MEYKISNQNISVYVNSKGAELQSIQKNGVDFEFLWQGDQRFWTGRAPILFPIVGGLKNKQYLLNGKIYSMPNHGILRISEFDMIFHTEDKVIFSFKNKGETLEMYPFECEVLVSYQIEGGKIVVTHEIINHSIQKMPFTFGLHPAFNLDDTLENTYVELSDEDLISTIDTENGFIIDKISDYGRKTLLFNQDTFSNDDTIIFDNLRSRKAVLGFKNSERYVCMTWTDDLPLLAFWSKANASYICIEPWAGWADSLDQEIGELSDKKGMINLNSQESKIISYAIEVF